MRQRLKQLPNLPEAPPFPAKMIFWGRLACFLLVFLSTFPLVVPFIFIQDIGRALRASNGIAILMLFLGGFALGQLRRAPPVADGDRHGHSGSGAGGDHHRPGRIERAAISPPACRVDEPPDSGYHASVRYPIKQTGEDHGNEATPDTEHY